MAKRISSTGIDALHLRKTANEELEKRIAERTAELVRANELLQKEIEERKQAEKALLESEEKFRLLFEKSAYPVFLLEGDTFVDCNETALRLTGCPSKELLVGRSPWELSPEKQPDGRLSSEKAKELVDAALRQGFNHFEWVRATLAGREVWIEVSLTVIPIRGRQIIYTEWRDITDRKRMEQELRKSRDQLELRVKERTEELQKAYDELLSETRQRQKVEEQLRQAQKMEAVGTLAGGIAHDFNNMLAVIIGNAELALDDIGRDGPRENLKQILQASMRSKSLVKQIVTFSRKSEGKRKPLHLAPLAKETAKLLRGSLPSTINIGVDVEIDSDIVLADPSQVQQVLMNLSTNAAHAMSEDGGTLTIGLSNATLRGGEPTADRNMQPGRYVVLTVHDTGTGMSKSVRNRIFEPFFTTKKPGQGTGMGLAVVFGIVKSHEGVIRVESKVGKGSTFKIFFPCYQGAAEEPPNEGRSLPKGKEKVLLVDDEPSIVAMASETLKRLGYAVTTAGSGPEGWRMFEADPQAFDIVVTDHVMPDLTGMRLAERISAVRKDLPIILCTGYSRTASPEKAQAAGISEFLTKPVSKRELAETIRRVLDSKNRDSIS